MVHVFERGPPIEDGEPEHVSVRDRRRGEVNTRSSLIVSRARRPSESSLNRNATMERSGFHGTSIFDIDQASVGVFRKVEGRVQCLAEWGNPVEMEGSHICMARNGRVSSGRGRRCP